MLQDDKAFRESTTKELHKALNKVAYEKSHRNDGIAYFLENYIKRAFASPSLMKSIADKLIPDLKSVETTSDQPPVRFTVNVVETSGAERTTDRTTQKPTNRMEGLQ